TPHYPLARRHTHRTAAHHLESQYTGSLQRSGRAHDAAVAQRSSRDYSARRRHLPQRHRRIARRRPPVPRRDESKIAPSRALLSQRQKELRSTHRACEKRRHAVHHAARVADRAAELLHTHVARGSARRNGGFYATVADERGALRLGRKHATQLSRS